jgi:CRISPR-associated protein Cas6
VLPWLESDTLAGIHHLSGLSPGSGEGTCYLSRRSRLTLRLARGRVAAAQALVGSRLHLAGSMIDVGAAKVRDLAHAPVLHAAFVTVGTADENAFMDACRQELAALGVSPRLICGKPQQARTPQGTLAGFSLMLHDLKVDAALLLQRNGLGSERKRGCGIFIPCKTIVAVGTLE